MTFRPYIAADPAAAPRPCATVKAVAAILAVDQSQVRRLVQTGELEAHTVGKRGVRIFLDSLVDYQQRKTRQPIRGAAGAPKPKIRRNPASTAAHRQALAVLRANGCLPEDGESPNGLALASSRRKAVRANRALQRGGKN